MDLTQKVKNSWPYIVIPANFLLANTFKYSYGLSIFSNGALTLLNYHDQVNSSNFQSVCHAGLSMLYGVRLAEFLHRRTSKPSYSTKLSDAVERSARSSFTKKLGVVTMVTTLMSAYVMPLMYSFKYAQDKDVKKSWMSWFGIGLAAVGIILQCFADEQKLKHKESVGGCIMDGTYKYIRHPNYTGEVFFHVGMYLGGFSAYTNWKKMSFAAFAPGFMTFVMLRVSKSLDVKQMNNYGDSAAYKVWKDRTWSLIPYIF